MLMICIHLCVSVMNDCNGKRDGRCRNWEYCYYKIFILLVRWFRVILKWTWISFKCVLQTLEQSSKFFLKRGITDMQRKQRLECGGEWVNGNSIHFPVNFAVNFKLL